MRRGDLAAAWAIGDAAIARGERCLWDGSPVAGRRVLVRCRRGLGDTLQFLRFLAPLAKVAAGVRLELPRELAPLCPMDRGVTLTASGAQAAPGEVELEIMELAHALRIERVEPCGPYLRAPEPMALPGAAPRIGLCWRSGGWDPRRDLPRALAAELTGLACFQAKAEAERVYARPYDAIEGFAWFSLQLGEALPRAPALAQADIRLTAAAISALDLVVSVDTMIAHLAGALGRPCWVLLPAACDWRWGHGAETPWYPSLRLFRQPEPGDWQGPLAALACALRQACPP